MKKRGQIDLPPKIRTINSRTDNDIVSNSVLLISVGFDGGYKIVQIISYRFNYLFFWFKFPLVKLFHF